MISLRTSIITVLLLCSPVVAEGASPYERTADQLSQAIDSYQKSHQKPKELGVAFRRDPMYPLVDKEGNLLSAAGLHEGLWVQGVIWSKERPLAVIDGDLFAQGDTIDQYTILEIRQDGVVVQNGETTQTIPLNRGVTPSGNTSP